LVESILRSVEQKSSVDGRELIVLALDATDFPAYSLRSVAERVRSECGNLIAAAGYQAVWLVGPSVDLVSQIA